MLSEKSYWIILIVTFTGIALLIWLWFIPYGIVEYNLGVNLLTSSIFMILTIVFLTWLFGLREKNQWKVVENEVYSSIRRNLRRIFTGILTYVEDADEIRESLGKMRGSETKDKFLVNELCKLKDAEEIRLDVLVVKALLEERILIEPFVTKARELSNIQLKYSKFLSPKLTLSLMKIQDYINDLESSSNLLASIKMLYEVSGKEMTDEKREKMLDSFVSLISIFLEQLIEEIYTLHKMGMIFPDVEPMR